MGKNKKQVKQLSNVLESIVVLKTEEQSPEEQNQRLLWAKVSEKDLLVEVWAFQSYDSYDLTHANTTPAMLIDILAYERFHHVIEQEQAEQSTETQEPGDVASTEEQETEQSTVTQEPAKPAKTKKPRKISERDLLLSMLDKAGIDAAANVAVSRGVYPTLEQAIDKISAEVSAAIRRISPKTEKSTLPRERKVRNVTIVGSVTLGDIVTEEQAEQAIQILTAGMRDTDERGKSSGLVPDNTRVRKVGDVASRNTHNYRFLIDYLSPIVDTETGEITGYAWRRVISVDNTGASATNIRYAVWIARKVARSQGFSLAKVTRTHKEQVTKQARVTKHDSYVEALSLLRSTLGDSEKLSDDMLHMLSVLTSNTPALPKTKKAEQAEQSTQEQETAEQAVSTQESEEQETETEQEQEASIA